MAERISLEMIKQAYSAVGGGIRGSLIEKALLKGAFDLVANPNDWRAPIDAVIDVEVCEYDQEVIEHAVSYFTCTKAEIFHTSNCPTDYGYLPRGKYRVKAIGYRGGPAGP